MHRGRFGGWAQLVGNIAIVAGIAILIYEVNQNKQLTNAQVLVADLAAIEARKTAQMGEDPRAALFKVEFCPEELTGEEAVTLSAYYSHWVVGWFKVYATSQIGGFDRNWREVVRSGIKVNFSNPVSRRWLKKYLRLGLTIVPDEIRDVAEAALAEAPGSGEKDLYAAILPEHSDATPCVASTSGR